MTFYLDGQADPNPTLRLRAGETVRLVLRNDDEGMTHDFAIPGWKAATKRIESGRRSGRHVPGARPAVLADLQVPAARHDDARYDTGRMTAPGGALVGGLEGPLRPPPVPHHRRSLRPHHRACSRSGAIAAGRRRSSRSPDVRPGTRALDLAAGTGDIAFGLAANGARVAALDITHRMLQIAAGKRQASARRSPSSPAT